MPHPFLYADLTGPIVDFCVNVIDDTGLAGVFLLMAAGSACIPIPSEAVMLFAGFTVSNGDQSLIGVVAAGAGRDKGGARPPHPGGGIRPPPPPGEKKNIHPPP